MMTNGDDETGVSRDDLVQRVALMETMIAEGRRATTRFGWIFVLWGAVDLFGIGWQSMREHSYWVWPITLTGGGVLQLIGIKVLCGTSHACGTSVQSRSISTVWSMMGIGTLLYVASAIASHLSWQVSYLSAILMMVGLAHAISAGLLRWAAQGVVAALWWIGGVAMFFVPWNYRVGIFTAEMFLGFFCFGLYAMMLDRKTAATTVPRHG